MRFFMAMLETLGRGGAFLWVMAAAAGAVTGSGRLAILGDAGGVVAAVL